SLYDKGRRLNPLKFSNGKTQEDVVREIVNSVNEGKKVILVHGACGTGKSAIALNVARALGRATIVVPVKNLQKQYEEDYTDRKYLLKKDGSRLSIAMLTGRENHDSIFKPGVSCADTTLPETIPISDKYFEQVVSYYKENPFVKHKAQLDSVSKLTRIAIAPANPYWSPILPAEVDLQLKDAKKKKYLGLNNREFVFHHRQKGCSYYDQYQAYLDADVLVFNAAKYKIECALDRKPKTHVDIIDEGDEFLDSFSAQYILNVNKLINALKLLYAEEETQSAIDKILLNLGIEEKRIKAIGVNEEKVFHIKETNLESVLRSLASTKGIEVEVSMDDLSYVHKGLEAAKQFADSLEETYLTYRIDNHELLVTFVTTNVAKKFNELVEKSGAMILLSGTLHSPSVLKNVFGIKDFALIDAEKANQGNLEIHMTGKEIDCKYENFKSGKHNREDYLKALNKAVEAAKKPTLIHVNAFEDLPSEIEIRNLELNALISKEQLRFIQNQDRKGEQVRKFKNGEIDRLFSTRCARGVDFPGAQCNSIVFTKYPNPDMRNTFWKILMQTHKSSFWDVYKDKAWREFLQRIYRALRSKDDHVYLLSPDKRVLDSARQFQLS
ncbi:MAG TPA: helicase C-terminal domain-containing protein, partial [Candidatus Nanoarchaeia archaeon]|nr:helicase C-terminal domain-containing protein [Candidatus Nanoarchaeia archaeon]